MAIRERSNTPMSAMTMSLPGAGSTNRKGVEHDDSSDRQESIPQRGRYDQRTTAGSSDAQRDRPSILVHSIVHEAKYLKGACITRDEVSKFEAFLERYEGNGEYLQDGMSKLNDTATA